MCFFSVLNWSQWVFVCVQVLLGIGPDGHVASLFPNSLQLAETKKWVVPITKSPKPPSRRISLSLPCINGAAHVRISSTRWFESHVSSNASSSKSSLRIALLGLGLMKIWCKLGSRWQLLLLDRARQRCCNEYLRGQHCRVLFQPNSFDLDMESWHGLWISKQLEGFPLSTITTLKNSPSWTGVHWKRRKSPLVTKFEW